MGVDEGDLDYVDVVLENCCISHSAYWLLTCCLKKNLNCCCCCFLHINRLCVGTLNLTEIVIAQLDIWLIFPLFPVGIIMLSTLTFCYGICSFFFRGV